jgi:hypothetical protein
VSACTHEQEGDQLGERASVRASTLNTLTVMVRASVLEQHVLVHVQKCMCMCTRYAACA